MKAFVVNMALATVILLVVAIGSIITIDWGLPASSSEPHWANTDVALAGQHAFNRAGCANCHSYIGQQGQSGGPRLDWVGEKYNEQLIKEVIGNPNKFFPNTIMPSYSHLPAGQQEAIAKYLATFKKN